MPMSTVLIAGRKSNFLQEIFHSFEREGVQPIYWNEHDERIEHLDYILCSTVGEKEDVGGYLRSLRSLALKNESRLILVTPATQTESQNLKNRDGKLDERHVYITQAHPLFTQSFWSELKRATFSPSLKNSDLHLNVESDSSDLPPVKSQTPHTERVEKVAAKPVFPQELRRPESQKPKRKRRYKLIFITMLFLLFALLPFIEFSMGTQLLKDQRLFRVSGFSENLLAGASRGFGVYRQLPLVGRYFKSFETKARQGATLAGVIHGFGQIVKETQRVAASFFGTGKSISSNEIDELSKRAQKLDKSLDFLIAEVKDNEEELETSEIRSKVKGTLWLLEYLRFITEGEEEKNYLVLINDSSQLRGSGGVVTGFGVMKVKDGKIESFNLSPVEELDSQLKGEVEPPALFKKYFQTNWYLRDAGWSPDYTSTALRAAWFLEKGTGMKVDGVFSLDTKTAKDFKRVFDKKDKEAIELFGRDLFESLNEKRVLASIQDQSFAGVLQELGWDGGIKEGVCVDVKFCLDDYLQIVSSNVVGVGAKLEKNYRLEVTIEKDKVSHKLTASYENPSPQDVKDYLRVYVQKEAESFSAVVLDTETGKQEQVVLDKAKEGGKSVYGFLLDLVEGEKREVIFSWSTKTSSENPKQYNLVWQKQAGEKEHAALLDIRYPGRTNPLHSIVGEDAPALTRKGSLLYNTDLTQDITLRLLWKD